MGFPIGAIVASQIIMNSSRRRRGGGGGPPRKPQKENEVISKIVWISLIVFLVVGAILLFS